MADVAVDEGAGHTQLEPRRACQECNRKKTKCDMRRPVCGLCLRTGNSCTFPLKRKKPTARKPQLKAQSRKISDSISKLVQVLESATQGGDGSDSTDTRREIPQTLLRDSLKGLLAEIRTSEDRGDAVRDASGTLPPLNQNANTGDPEADDDMQHDDDHDTDDHDSAASTDSRSNDTSAKSSAPPVVLGSAGEITSSLAVDLVNLFFDKIQPWLPLLHRPRFQAEHEEMLLAEGDIVKGLPLDESLLFYSMFAMAARFSNHSRFASIPCYKRGHEFAERAREVYTQARSLRTPSLTYLQGCILLSFYFYTSGPTHQGWILIGICVRLAYDLGLAEIDDEDWSPTTTVDWVAKEEMRRAWWLVWELDAFASTVSRNPYSIDRKRMAVTLPISDDAWFAEIDVPSAELVLLPGQSWRSLSGSTNQDERAWFLVANNFMATIHDRLQQRHDVTADEKLTLENEVCCFKLALPPTLRLDAENLNFTSTSFARCNWVIGTHLMLMAASFMVSGIATTENDDRSVSSMSAGVGSPLRQRAIDLSRIISLWDSRYIAVAHPFFSCMMLPPHAVETDILKTQPLISSSHDLAKLVLAHVSEKWKLGSVVSELAKLVEKGGSISNEQRQLAKRYAVFFRIPRLSSSSPNFPPDASRRERKSSIVSDAAPYKSIPDMPQPSQPQQPQPQHQQQTQRHMQPPEEYAASISPSDQMMANNYQAIFDSQLFPPLQPGAFDGSNDIDFGFSDFFGYRDTDFQLPWPK